MQPLRISTKLWRIWVHLISAVFSCPLPHAPHPPPLTPSILRFKTKASPEVKVENSTRSLVESHAEASVETAGCSVRKKHLELQVCNSRPMRSMCHGDDGIYRLMLLYMNLAQLPIDRMQKKLISIAHCNLFISPQFYRLTPKMYITAKLKKKVFKLSE